LGSSDRLKRKQQKAVIKEHPDEHRSTELQYPPMAG
jgi:hypothetical protein